MSSDLTIEQPAAARPRPAAASYQCTACQARRTVTLATLDHDAVGAHADELATLQRHLTYATCPACGVRDPRAVAEHARARRRQRLWFAAGYAALAGLAIVVPLLALLVPAYALLIWAILLVPRWRRRLWGYIVLEGILYGAMAGWVVTIRQYAYVVPASIAALVLWPRGDAAEPFTEAAKHLTFGEPLP